MTAAQSGLHAGHGLGTGRRRALLVTGAVTLTSLGLLADLLLIGHTTGEEVWGPVVAASSALVGLLSLAYLATSRRSRAALVLLVALWATVAFLGYGGYNDHKIPVTVTSADQRHRPPLAPLAFTGLGLVGAVSLVMGSRGARRVSLDQARPNPATRPGADPIV